MLYYLATGPKANSSILNKDIVWDKEEAKAPEGSRYL
jgi:hypothetical protein